MKRTLPDFAPREIGVSRVSMFFNLETRLEQSCTYLLVQRLKNISLYFLLCAKDVILYCELDGWRPLCLEMAER